MVQSGSVASASFFLSVVFLYYILVFNMKTFIALALAGAAFAATPHETAFMQFITEHGKSY